MATKTLVDTDSTQTLSGKTLTAPTVTSPSISTPTITGDITVDRLNLVNDFRLTLTTAVPVTTADVLAAETLYCTPYIGNTIALYSGSAWVLRDSTQFSVDVPDVTGVHDVFCYDNSGTPTLETLVWTNETTRATALAYQDGVLVKSGAATRRYLGTFYSTTAGNGQIEDSVANRYLWNYYHRVWKTMKRVDGTDTWSYTTATIRQANGSTANQLNFVIGVSEDVVRADLLVSVANDGAGRNLFAGIGLDSTTTAVTPYSWVTSPVGSYQIALTATYSDWPGIGKHFLSWLEYSTAAGTTTWVGDNGSSTVITSGLTGAIRC